MRGHPDLLSTTEQADQNVARLVLHSFVDRDLCRQTRRTAGQRASGRPPEVTGQVEDGHECSIQEASERYRPDRTPWRILLQLITEEREQ